MCHIYQPGVPVYSGVRRSISHPSGQIFHGRYLHSSLNGIGAKKVGVGNIYSINILIVSRDLSEAVSLGVGTLLVVEQSSLESRPYAVLPGPTGIKYGSYSVRTFIDGRYLIPWYSSYVHKCLIRTQMEA